MSLLEWLNQRTPLSITSQWNFSMTYMVVALELQPRRQCIATRMIVRRMLSDVSGRAAL